MNHSKIGTFEAITLILSLIIAHTVLSLPKDLLDSTNSATFINLIYVSFLAIIFIIIVCKLLKNFPGMDIVDISEFLGGKVLKCIIGTMFTTYFLLSSGIFLRNFCEYLRIIYYPSTNVIFLISIFIIAICIVNSLEFNAIFKASSIITPFALISIIFLFFANIRYFSPERIFPILGNSFSNTFIMGIGNIYAFSGTVCIYFLPPLLKEPKNFKKIAVSSVFISGCYILLAVSIVIFMFPFFAKVDKVIPLYAAARYVEFGSFFQRLEAIFLLIWIVAFCCYLGILNIFSIHIFRRITKINYIKPIVIPFGLVMLGISLLPTDHTVTKFFESVIYRFMVLGITYILSFCILLFANYKKKKQVVKRNE